MFSTGNWEFTIEPITWLYLVFRDNYTRNYWLELSFYPRPVLAFEYCRCLHLSVCVHVYVGHPRVCPRHNSSPLQDRITKFGSEVQNTLVKIPNVWGQMTLTFKVKFKLKVPNLPHFALVHTITHHLFKLGSPNLDQWCKTPWLRSLLFLWMVDVDLYGQI